LSVTALVARYGLLAIFVGAGLEGETVVVAGGIAAREGLLPLPGAMIAAGLGSCLVDQCWFFLGRYGRTLEWVARLTRRPAFARATQLVERYPTAFIFGFRFVYGMRTVSPIAIGTTRVRTRRFVPTNAFAAAVWGPLFTLIGYAFGMAIEPLLHRVKHGGLLVAGALVALGLLASGILWLVRRRRDRPRAPSPEEQSS
jgi:membrane protein DedA with SNARE-associated domain